MSENKLPLIIEPDALEVSLAYDNLLIVDLSKKETYQKMHIPGAVHIDYPQIIAASRQVMGLVPDDATLERVFSALGIDEHTHVVAYDDEGGGCAARLLWTLEVTGHRHYSLLNGGLHAWANEGHPLEDTPVSATAKTFQVRRTAGPFADSAYVSAHLDSDGCCLLDARSPAEYSGIKRYAERAGHIPGAVNLEWTRAIDSDRNLRLRSDEELTALLSPLGVTADKEVIVYCQTHHRSAHTYIMLKQLGFENVKGYAGSWSDWGNNPDLPIEVGLGAIAP
jgi:thiosulfate/3-mercaptopyruvate sulfurtransferase